MGSWRSHQEGMSVTITCPYMHTHHTHIICMLRGCRMLARLNQQTHACTRKRACPLVRMQVHSIHINASPPSPCISHPPPARCASCGGCAPPTQSPDADANADLRNNGAPLAIVRPLLVVGAIHLDGVAVLAATNGVPNARTPACSALQHIFSNINLTTYIQHCLTQAST